MPNTSSSRRTRRSRTLESRVANSARTSSSEQRTTLSHAPQLFGSDPRSTQELPQGASPGAHEKSYHHAVAVRLAAPWGRHEAGDVVWLMTVPWRFASGSADLPIALQ